MPALEMSRPHRLATELRGTSAGPSVEDRIRATVVAVRMDESSRGREDAFLTFRSVVDQISRFTATVTVVGSSAATDACVRRGLVVHGDERVRVADDATDLDRADIVVAVGTTSRRPLEIVVCNDGWLGRVTTLPDGLPMPTAAPNRVGALGAASLAAGEVFLQLFAPEFAARGFELSLWTGEVGVVGALASDPPIPDMLPELDALLIGCGNVANGWVDAIGAEQLRGHLTAVDRQALGAENSGTYLLARRDMIGQPKTLLVAQRLEPNIEVTRHDEELRLFTPRITRWNKPMPRLVINGLDNVEARHDVQRLWPHSLIDMAAQGLTCQVLTHGRGEGGRCLLGAFTNRADEVSYEHRVANRTGLRPERLIDEYNTPITDADVAAAPSEHRASLEGARRAGWLVCGYVNAAAMTEGASAEFAAAAPFTGGLAGARAAALTIRTMMGDEVASGHQWRFSFLSARSLVRTLDCDPDCACTTSTAA